MYEMEGPQLIACHRSADRSANHVSCDRTAKSGLRRQITAAWLCLPGSAARNPFLTVGNFYCLKGRPRKRFRKKNSRFFSGAGLARARASCRP
jgi:hypothetical protein